MSKLSLLTIAALAASANALKVSSAPVMKPVVNMPSSASNALALRGGGIVPQSAWLKAFSGFMGMYAVGFVLAPNMVRLATHTRMHDLCVSTNHNYLPPLLAGH